MNEESEAFERVAKVIAPLRDHVVVIGGWAHRLHRCVPLAMNVGFPVLLTNDIDLAIDAATPSSTVRLDRQLELAGFRAQRGGYETPAATRYTPLDRPTPYVEFVVHRSGSGASHRQGAGTRVEIAGVVAAKLRHINLLGICPWEVELTAEHGFRVDGAPLRLNVANPSSFIAQKLWIAHLRHPKERAKDIVYVFDTLLTFGSAFSELAQLWSNVADSLHKTTRSKVCRLAQDSTRVVDDHLRDAAEIIRSLDRPDRPDANELRDGLQHGLARVFLTE